MDKATEQLKKSIAAEAYQGEIQNATPMSHMFDGGHLPRYIPPPAYVKPIKFLEPWGEKSRYVEFKREYDNMRNSIKVPKHVELRTQKEVDDGVQDTTYHKMEKGAIYKLEGIHKNGRMIAWNVDGLTKETGNTIAHFTVQFWVDPYMTSYQKLKQHYQT